MEFWGLAFRSQLSRSDNRKRILLRELELAVLQDAGVEKRQHAKGHVCLGGGLYLHIGRGLSWWIAAEVLIDDGSAELGGFEKVSVVVTEQDDIDQFAGLGGVHALSGVAAGIAAYSVVLISSKDYYPQVQTEQDKDYGEERAAG